MQAFYVRVCLSGVACSRNIRLCRWLAHSRDLSVPRSLLRWQDTKPDYQRAASTHEVPPAKRFLPCLGVDKEPCQEVSVHELLRGLGSQRQREMQEANTEPVVSGAI